MDAKTKSWVSYLTLIGWIIAYVNNQNPKEEQASFHIRQSLGLIVFSVGLYLVLIILTTAILSVSLGLGLIVGVLSWLIYIGMIGLWIYGLINAVNDNRKMLPVIGPLAAKWFAKI